MLTAAVTLTVFGFVLVMVTDVIRRDGQKIIAALEGHSWTAGSTSVRPVTIRFNQPNRAPAPVRKWQPELRAAA